LEKRVHEHAGDKEAAWDGAGKETGVQVWRIEQFHVKAWPKEKYGTFYDGDSYIVLHTYKKRPDAEAFSFDLHFWLGENTSQDEAGTAAYKTVELDDHLGGVPVQYRETQNEESQTFMSYWKHFHLLQGGAATGFHHVTEHADNSPHRLFVIKVPARHSAEIIVYQMPLDGKSLSAGSVFVLDKGKQIWQFNKSSSHGKERFKGAEFAKSLEDSRKGNADIQVFEEHGHGAGIFLSELNIDAVPTQITPSASNQVEAVLVHAVRHDDGINFTALPSSPSKNDLQSSGIFLLDTTSAQHPALYVWVGKEVVPAERRLVMQIAQTYLHRKEGVKKNISIVRLDEGRESDSFLHLF